MTAQTRAELDAAMADLLAILAGFTEEEWVRYDVEGSLAWPLGDDTVERS